MEEYGVLSLAVIYYLTRVQYSHGICLCVRVCVCVLSQISFLYREPGPSVYIGVIL